MITIEHSHLFESGVAVRVIQYVREIRAASQEEPADLKVIATELIVNNEPVDARKYWKLADYVLSR